MKQKPTEQKRKRQKSFWPVFAIRLYVVTILFAAIVWCFAISAVIKGSTREQVEMLPRDSDIGYCFLVACPLPPKKKKEKR